MSWFSLLLLFFKWPLALSQTTADMYSVCFGKGSVCGAYINVTCSLDSGNPKPYYSCFCGTQLPLQQSCDVCRYEYASTTYTVDNWFFTSRCSREGVPVGTIPADVVLSFDEHTRTISLAKSRTFNSTAMLSSYSVKATSKPIITSNQNPETERWTLTFGGSTQAFTPLETAPPSVEDTDGGESGGRTNTVSLTLLAMGIVAAALWW